MSFCWPGAPFSDLSLTWQGLTALVQHWFSETSSKPHWWHMHGTNSNPESAQRLLSDLQVIGIALPDTFHCEMDFEENLEHPKKDLHIQQLFPPSPIYATMLIYFFSISLLSFFNGPIIPCENIVRIGIEWCIYRQFLNLIIDALTICYSLVGFMFLECRCVFKNKIFFFFCISVTSLHPMRAKPQSFCEA